MKYKVKKVKFNKSDVPVFTKISINSNFGLKNEYNIDNSIGRYEKNVNKIISGILKDKGLTKYSTKIFETKNKINLVFYVRDCIGTTYTLYCNLT